MACYNSLIFTATALGETKIAATCRTILREEQPMAATLASQLKAVNREPEEVSRQRRAGDAAEVHGIQRMIAGRVGVHLSGGSGGNSAP